MRVWHTSTEGSPDDALALIEQALAQPDRPDQWQAAAGASLVDAMPLLIQLASGDKDAVARARTSTAGRRVNDAALRMAAIQCLRHLYLAHSDDPFRVLGLNPWVGYEQVRERYRKLIRLFHPDRGALHEQADTALAANLNLAYTRAVEQIQTGVPAAEPPSSRSSMAAHTPGGAGKRNKHAASIHRKRRIAIDRQPARALLPEKLVDALTTLGVFRMKPVTVWAVVLLAGGGLVASAWFRDQINDQNRSLVVTNDRPAVRPTPPAFNFGLEPDRKIPAGGVVEAPRFRSKAVDESDTAEEADVKKTAASPVTTSLPHGEHFGTTRSAATSGSPTIAPARAAVEQGTSAAAMRPFSASAEDIDHFLAEFLSSYADGDLDELLSLMHDNMSYDTPGGKGAARRAYQRLFLASTSRDLILRDVVWNRYGERMVASPRFEERITMRGTGEVQSQKGVMHIELVEQSGRITIAALSHKTLGIAP